VLVTSNQGSIYNARAAEAWHFSIITNNANFASISGENQVCFFFGQKSVFPKNGFHFEAQVPPSCSKSSPVVLGFSEASRVKFKLSKLGVYIKKLFVLMHQNSKRSNTALQSGT